MNMYKRLCTEFYDLDKPTAAQEDLDVYLPYCQPNLTILEAMSGTGRFLLPMLAQGFAIEGVDASPDMLAVCRHKASKQGLEVRLYQQFLHALALPKTYDRIIIPAASFGLITEEEKISASLQRLHAHLNPGGQLVVEVEPPANRPQVFGTVNAVMRERCGGSWIILTSFAASFDCETQVGVSINKYELIEQGRLLETEYEQFSIRYHDQDAFAKRLQQAGFSINTVRTAAETIVFVCERIG